MKMNSNLMTILACAGLVVFVTWVNQINAQSVGVTATSVAVVDVEKVFANLAEREGVEAEIQTRIAQLQRWQQEKKLELDELQGDLEIVARDSAEYAQTREKIRRGLIELKVEVELAQGEIEQQKSLKMEQIYRKIIDSVGVIAQQSGYDLVMFRDQTPPMAGASRQQIATLIQVRKCLYAADHLDITERVKQKMNNDYNTRG